MNGRSKRTAFSPPTAAHGYAGGLPGWCDCGRWFNREEEAELNAHLAVVGGERYSAFTGEPRAG